MKSCIYLNIINAEHNIIIIIDKIYNYYMHDNYVHLTLGYPV